MIKKCSLSWDDLQETQRCVKAIESASQRHRPLLREFSEWLFRDRGLAPATVHSSLELGRRFLEGSAAGLEPILAFQRMTVEDVEGFFVNLAPSTSVGMRSCWRTVVRRLLHFAATRGWITPLLEKALPTIRSYRLAHVVRGIEDEQVRQLLVSVPENSAAALRDRAILLLLAVYGVRSGQIRALKLGDVYWKDRLIWFAEHKGGKPVSHELLPQVAGAVARYIQEARPPGPHKEIFLLVQQPYTPLSRSVIGQIVRTRLAKAGLSTPSKGPHQFRHAFATRLLRSGHSLKTISDLLGHRELGSAAIYTKVDEPTLRHVANEWPEVLS